jgi:hypothetical protein
MSLDLGNIPIGTSPNLTQQQQMRTALVAAGNAPSNGEKYAMRDGQWVYLIEASRAYDSANNILLTEPRNIIPDSWTNTNPGAVASVDFKSTLTSIGDYAFSNCNNLTSVTIPNSVTSIGSYAFYICSALTSVTIPSSVTTIGSNAFGYCNSLTNVTIGSGVTTIGSYAFYSCVRLTAITVSSLNLIYSSVDGVLFDKDQITLIQYPEGNPELTYSIPNSVIILEGNAFVNCHNLTSVTIPNSVTTISSGVFFNASGLTSLTIPNSVTSIGGQAFWNCTSMTSVTIGSGVTSIGSGTFQYCTSLNYIACLATTAPTLPIENNVFTNVLTTVIRVPIGATGYDTYFGGLSVLYDI